MLTTRQVAERLQVTEHTVRQWLKSGKLVGVMPGGTKMGWRIPEGEVRRLLGQESR